MSRDKIRNMTAVVEHIKKEILSLAPDEASELFRSLRRDFPMVETSEAEGDASAEAAWNQETDVRAEEVENGTVEVLSAEESDRRSEAVFARFGAQRPAYGS